MDNVMDPNFRIDPPRSVNADLMTDEELIAKLRRGLAEAEAGLGVDAAEAFAEFRAKHKFPDPPETLDD